MRQSALFLFAWLLLFSASPISGQDNDPHFGPLPLPTVEPITVNNAQRLERLATIGIGEIEVNVAWSPDEHWLAAPSSAGVWLYETTDWNTYPRLLASPGAGVLTVLYSRDGRLLYAGDQNGDIQIWETSTQLQIASLVTGLKAVYNATLSPDGSRLAASGPDGFALWQGNDQLPANNTFDFKLLAFRQVPSGKLTFSPDGLLLFRGGSYFTDAISGEQLLSIPTVPREMFENNIDFSADGRLIAGIVDGQLQIWDYANRVWVQTLPIASVYDFAFIDNGEHILVSAYRIGTELWDVNSGEKLRDLPSEQSFNRAISVSPSEDKVVYGFSIGIEVWSLESDTNLLVLHSDVMRLFNSRSITFSPTNSLIYTNNTSRFRGLWLADLDQNHFENLAPSYQGFGFAFTPEGDWMLTAGHALRLWYLPERVLDAVYPHESNYSVAYNPADDSYVSGGSVIRIWDFETRTLRRVVGEAFGAASDLNFNHDGTKLVSVHTSDNLPDDNISRAIVVMWNTEDYEPILTLENRMGPVVFQPGTNRLLVHECVSARSNGLCERKNAHLVDTATGETLYTLYFEMETPLFSPDGSLLVAGTVDGQLVLWDVENNTQLGQWQADNFYSKVSAAFSPDSRYIVTMNGTSTSQNSAGVGTVWGVVNDAQ